MYLLRDVFDNRVKEKPVICRVSLVCDIRLLSFFDESFNVFLGLKSQETAGDLPVLEQEDVRDRHDAVFFSEFRFVIEKGSLSDNI